MYNFIIIGYNSDMYFRSYGDIFGLNNVQYVPENVNSKISPTCLFTKNNRLINLLHKIHHSTKINKYFNFPFKNLWFKYYFKPKFNKNSKIIFLLFGRQLHLFNAGYIDYLKNEYPNSKFVCFFQDLIKTHVDVNISEIKKKFDMVISFDQKDANQFEIDYFPLVNSRTKFSLNSDFEESDVYFLGYAKDRLSDIVLAYEELKKIGLKCSFYVVNAKKEEIKYKDEINYINGMSYEDNLKHIQKTKCILELMQKGGVGYTQRMMEAIIYNKLIVTNNESVKVAEFYNTSNILQIQNIRDIGTNEGFFNNIDRTVDHKYRDKISPINLLNTIVNKLEKGKK